MNLGNSNKTSQNYKILANSYPHFREQLNNDRKIYSARVSLFSLVLSILSIHFVSYFLEDYLFSATYGLMFAYIFAASGVTYELYNGLNMRYGERYKPTPWKFFKLSEIVLMLGFNITAFCTFGFFNLRFAAIIFYGFVILGLNIILTYMVAYRRASTIDKNPRNISFVV